MYDWSNNGAQRVLEVTQFQLLLKGCTIEACWRLERDNQKHVSVVVERMYDWSGLIRDYTVTIAGFQLLLKGCTIEAQCHQEKSQHFQFQLLLKGCTIEAQPLCWQRWLNWVSVVVERMYDWSTTLKFVLIIRIMFQLLLKGCTIEASSLERHGERRCVSVVVERMYDWSCNCLCNWRISWVVSVVVERMYDWSWNVSLGASL